MAKKKAANSHQDNKPSQKQEDFVKTRQEVTPAMDAEASEKIDSLKSLNQLLVKEAVERRHLVESLIQSKGSLEMELTRSNSESEALRSELTQLGDKAAELELERTVVAAFVSAQVALMGNGMKGLEAEMRVLKGVVDEKESEIERLNGELNEVLGEFRNEKNVAERVRLERDGMKDMLDREIEEAKVLRRNFVEMEERKKSVEREIGELRAMFDVVRGEKEKSEMRIESITIEKDLIDTSLSESNKLMEEIKGELGRVVDEKETEIERWNGKLNEVLGEFRNEKNVAERVRLERDGMKDMLDREIEEAKMLRWNFVEMEERKKSVEREIGELRAMFDVVRGEKEKSEMRIESITIEKDLIDRSLLESNKLMEEIKEELGRVVNEKERIEEERNAETFKKKELEKTISQVNELVSRLQKDGEKLSADVAELEKKCIASEEMQKEMGRETDKLMEEKKMNEKKIEELIDMKSEIEKDFNNALKKLDEQKLEIEKMGNERMITMEAKSRVESEVVALRKEGVELKAVVSKLEGSMRAEVVKIKSLESEVGNYKSKLEEVKVERDKMETYLDEEKVNSVKLKEKIGELDKKVEESLKAIEETKGNNAAIFAEKVELESRCEMLKKEISSLKDMLKETTLSFCSKDDDIGVAYKKEINGDEEAKGYLMEIEMIKNAFKSKESKVEGMKRQVELLQSCVEDAHKKKSFWTALSSATTLLAAISLAYVARGH